MIVHRDLKPANLMLGGIPHETGTREMVRLVPRVLHLVYPSTRRSAVSCQCVHRSAPQP